METIGKGNAAEAAVLSALVSRGLHVLVPFGEGHPYDLVVDLGGRDFLRVQCKCARMVKGCVLFNAHGTDHGRGRTSYLGTADIFGAYLPAQRTVYLVPVADSPATLVSLRVEPTLNNQRSRVRLARDYAIDRWDIDRLRHLLEGDPFRMRRPREPAPVAEA